VSRSGEDERGDEPRIGFAKRAPPATGAANAPLRQRFGIEIVFDAIDRRTSEPGDLRDDRQTASTGGPHLRRRKQPPPIAAEWRPRRSCDRLIPNLCNPDSLDDSRITLALIQHGERRRFVMSVPIPLRVDFDAARVRGLAKKTKDGPQARRLLALAAIYDGATRSEAAKIGGVGLQIIRDWVMRFNARGPDGLLDGKSPGQPSKLNDVQRQAIARIIESGPIPAAHGVVRWRLIDLAQWIYEEFRITIAKQTLSRELRAMGYRKLSARPRHHAQATGAIEDFKKASQRAWTQLRVRRQSMSRP
jgi:transposase